MENKKMATAKNKKTVASLQTENSSDASKLNKSKGDKKIVISYLFEHKVICEESDAANELYNKSRYGVIVNGKLELSLLEALFLLEKKSLQILDGRKKPFETERFIRKAQKLEPNFWVRYCVFRDFRTRGYIIKTALKFGADFRVYDRGIKPGEDHAKWIVYPVHEANVSTWYEFSAKNRVAHSTKKRLLVGVVDDENDVTYWEIKWVRP